jgi:hypothetical protein
MSRAELEFCSAADLWIRSLLLHDQTIGEDLLGESNPLDGVTHRRLAEN